MKQCDNGHFYDEARFDQCPYCVPSSAGKTVAATPTPAAGKTMPFQPQGGNDGKTVGVMKKSLGIDPVVGFVVCVDGPQKGESFTLVSGRNFVGRGASMDVALTEDDTVSRENHALISYDAKGNSFMLSPGMGRGITYLNGAQIESAVILAAYDKIEVGSSALLFLPLCGERFRWEQAK